FIIIQMNGRFIADRSQQLHYLPQTYLLCFEMNSYFICRKIDAAILNSGVDFMQMLQQPHAGAAMNSRYKKLNNGKIPVRKTIKAFGYSRLIQIGVFFFSQRLDAAQPGVRLQMVIIAKPVVCQQFIDQLATGAAEKFFFYTKLFVKA